MIDRATIRAKTSDFLGMNSSTEATINGELANVLECCFGRASLLEYPAFTTAIAESTPLNAAPYLTTLDALENVMPGAPRKRMLKSLRNLLDDLERAGHFPRAVLVGGSFLRLSKVPKDLDCVVFYETHGSPQHQLADLQKTGREQGLDVRLIPFDVDPIFVLKMGMYFGLLYSRSKSKGDEAHGCVIVRL